jgi:hypothetical protein
MFGKQTAGTKKPGQTGKIDKSSGKWIKGGGTGYIGGKQPKSSHAVKGRVSVSKGC